MTMMSVMAVVTLSRRPVNQLVGCELCDYAEQADLFPV